MSGSEYLIPSAALAGIVSLSALPLFITSCFVIPQRKDPARRGFIWLKAAFFFIFLGGILQTIGRIVSLLIWYDVLDNLSNYDLYSEAMARLSSWGFFLVRICAILLFFSLVDVAVGIFYCLGRLPKARRIAQWLAYGFGFLQFVLELTSFAKYESFNTKYYNHLKNGGRYSTLPDPSEIRPFDLLSAAASVLFCAAYIAELGLSILVITIVRRGVEHHKTAVLLLVASIFAFIRSVYNLAAAAAFWIPEMTPSSARLDLILSAVFGCILLFVSLVLLFAAGVKKIGGLWSTAQNFAQPVQYYYPSVGQAVPIAVAQPYLQQGAVPVQYMQPVAQDAYPPHISK